LGLKSIRNEDDDYAGLLDLAKNPEAIHAKIAADQRLRTLKSSLEQREENKR
jgi:hypothetical protein